MKHVFIDPLTNPSPPAQFDLPPPIVSTHNFCLDCPKSLSFSPIVLKRWDLLCGRKRGKISDARFQQPVSCQWVLGSTIARRRWRWEGPNPTGRQVESRNGTRKLLKEGCNTRTSKEVTHSSTTLDQTQLNVEF